jgi:hypothetical protein
MVVALLFATLVIPHAVAQEEESATAYVHVLHLVADGPNVDVYVDQEAALEDFAPGMFSEFMELAPGAHTIEAAPAGEGLDAAVIQTEVELEEGHRYTIAIMGQVADDDVHALVIDETAAMEETDMSQNVFRIIINNIAGSPPISFYENNAWVEQNIEYGSYSAQGFTPFTWDTGKAVAGDDLNDIVFDFDSEEDQSAGFWEPYTVYVYGLLGRYPGAMFEDYTFADSSYYVVAPDVATFLDAFDEFEVTSDYQTYYRFDTFVAALEAAGMTEELDGGEPVTVFVPVDQAFEALEEGRLEELMADPDALREILEGHIVEGAYPSYDDLVAAGTLTTLAGTTIEIGNLTSEDGFYFYINDDVTVANFPYPLLENGSVVYFVEDAVLMPPSD